MGAICRCGGGHRSRGRRPHRGQLAATFRRCIRATRVPGSRSGLADPAAPGVPVSLGEWLPRADLGPDVTFTTPPQAIELSLMPSSRGGEEGVYVAQPPAGTKGSIHRWATWALTPDGTLDLRLSTGFSGVTMELGPDGRDLVGRAKTFWDFPRISQWATVRATHCSCPDQHAE
jgi:hypothetical protein